MATTTIILNNFSCALGMNKLIVNTLEKMFVTSDAATMMREMEVVHPAAKLLVMACQQQEQESGDGTNLVLIFAGELLKGGEALLKMGMHASEIVEGYERAFDLMMQRLEANDLCIGQLENTSFGNNAGLKGDAFKAQCRDAVASAIGSKQYGYETFLSGLVLDAAIQVMPWHNQKAFQVDSVRIVKIMGGQLLDSHMISGMVFNRQPER
jgi:T-complex protein 1 subunit theta